MILFITIRIFQTIKLLGTYYYCTTQAYVLAWFVTSVLALCYQLEYFCIGRLYVVFFHLCDILQYLLYCALVIFEATWKLVNFVVNFSLHIKQDFLFSFNRKNMEIHVGLPFLQTCSLLITFVPNLR